MIYSSHFIVSMVTDLWIYEIWEPKALIQDTFYILLSLYFVGPLLEAIDIPHLIILAKRWMATRNIEKGLITQHELNQLYEGKIISFSLIYTRINIVWQMSMFLTPIYPLAPIMFLLYLVLMYWITKYNLLRRCKQPFKAGPAIFFYCFNNIKNGIHSFFVRNIIIF